MVSRQADNATKGAASRPRQFVFGRLIVHVDWSDDGGWTLTTANDRYEAIFCIHRIRRVIDGRDAKATQILCGKLSLTFGLV